MPSLTNTGIIKEASRVLFRFGHQEYEFPSIAAAQDFVRDKLNRDDMVAIYMALCFTRQPALGNPAVLAGKTLTIDLNQINWGTIG
jgi:hypothetical protein